VRRGQGRLAGWLLIGSLLIAARARASYEEFSTFDVGRTELDDEWLLDHQLVGSPSEWHDEYDRSLNAFRSSQGCFTAGVWHMDNDLKFEVPLGDTTRFVLGYHDFNDLEATYTWTRLDARFPMPHAGLWGIRFSPTFDKSRQDLSLLWDRGNMITPLQVSAVFTLEDAFNNFWSARQTRVGDESEPYVRHPYEPALSVTWRGAGPKFSARGKWLTPSTKTFDTKDPSLHRQENLWGAKGDGALWYDVRRTTARVDFETVQASSFSAWDSIPGDHHVYRRRWVLQASLARPVGEHARVALRYFYQDRLQVWRPPISNSTLNVIDRMLMLEGDFRGPWALGIHVGGMRDHISVWDNGGIPASTMNSRNETRAFIQLQKLFGKVRIQGTEGIELDQEPYPVSFHHDKGFLQIQTTF
jgi:hypothetical protein